MRHQVNREDFIDVFLGEPVGDLEDVDKDNSWCRELTQLHIRKKAFPSRCILIFAFVDFGERITEKDPCENPRYAEENLQEDDDVTRLANVVDDVAHQEKSEQERHLQEEYWSSKGWVIEGLTALNDADNVQFNHGDQQSQSLEAELINSLAPQLPPFLLSYVILGV